MLKSIILSGYRPHELGIFNESHPGVEIIKRAIREQLLLLLTEGLEWVIISGQQGVETWGADVVFELQQEYDIKLGIITPFLNQQERWNDAKKEKYDMMIMQADFVDSATKKPYEAPWQFIEKDKFLIRNTSGALLVYDEEQEASPKFLKRLIKAHAETTDYAFYEINAYDLQLLAEQIQEEKWQDY